jgi:hypothetical protein
MVMYLVMSLLVYRVFVDCLLNRYPWHPYQPSIRAINVGQPAYVGEMADIESVSTEIL